jgi:probable F420-dependent oxidoreductase
MRIGVAFPSTEVGNDPVVIRDFAQTAEGLGFAHILVYDHILGVVREGRDRPLAGVHSITTPFHEAFVLIGWLAALTSRIEFATGVLVLPQRETALVAKQAAEIDILSGERLRLGVGTGWNYVEFEGVSARFAGRGRRQEEQVEVMRRLWAEPVVDFTGQWHRIDRAGLCPLPNRQVPVWFGGWSDPAFERAVRLGEGFIFGPARDPIEGIDSVRGFLDKAGRDPQGFGLDVVTTYSADPAEMAAGAQRFRDKGATHLTVRTMEAGLATPRDHIDALGRLAAAVGDLD